MSQLENLTHAQLVSLVNELQQDATETFDIWKSRIGTHSLACHTHHAGCLAALTLSRIRVAGQGGA